MTAATYPKCKTLTYRVWTYDVWGNARDGWEVNDRCSHGTVDIVCKADVHNAGTDREFVSYHPTDRQLSRASGFLRCEWEWSDNGYYANTKSGMPVGELELQD